MEVEITFLPTPADPMNQLRVSEVKIFDGPHTHSFVTATPDFHDMCGLKHLSAIIESAYRLGKETP